MTYPATCNHRWNYDQPTIDTNPEQHFRECELCGLVQRRDWADGKTLTEWTDVKRR